MSIAGGFGTLKLGNTDAVSSSFDMNPSDLVQEEAAGTLNDGAATPSGIGTISTDTGTGGANTTKVSYMLPSHRLPQS